jgi:hypothetical protein
MASFNDNNPKELVDRIIRQTQDVKSVLRDLREYIKSKAEVIPERLLKVLRERSLLLAGSIKEYKLKKYGSEKTQNVFEALDETVRKEPQKLMYPDKDEFELYSEFGVTKEVYYDILEWQKSIAKYGEDVNFSEAYNHFVEHVLRNKEKDPDDDWRKLVPAATGLVGIGSDIAIFATTGNIITLYASCTNGVLTIVASFKAVRKKFQKWFGKK